MTLPQFVFLVCLELSLAYVRTRFHRSVVLVGLVLWKLLSFDISSLFHCLVHGEEGVQGLESQRESLLLAVL